MPAMSDLHPQAPPAARPRRWLCCLGAAAGLLLLLLAAATGLVFWTLPDVAPLQDPRATVTITVRDWQGQEHPFLLGPQNRHWTPLGAIPAAMKWAVIVAEDATFYEHQGLDLPALREAFKYNLEQKRLARGASTITQQLAKNVYLSRQKSLWRKLREILLARRLEDQLGKGRILELYLNVVELGPKVHGVGQGARHFFGKGARELTAAECALLAAILPGPRVAYNPQRQAGKVHRRAARILHLLQGRGILDQEQLTVALRELPLLLGLPASTAEPAPGPADAPLADPDDLPEEEPLEIGQEETWREEVPDAHPATGEEETEPLVPDAGR
jgi:monofunctional glycosyltransferase